MRIYVDLDQRQLTSSLGVNSPLPALYFKRGDSEDLTVQFTRNGSVVDPDPDTLFFCVKEVGDYDGDPVVLCTDFTKAGSGTTAEWTGTPDFGTEALNDLLGVGAAADVASVTLNAEVGFNIDGRDTTARTVECVVENDLYRGTETAPPAYPRSQVITFYPDITELAGSEPNCLDTLPTVNVAVGVMIQFVTGDVLSTWKLEAGTSAEDGVTVIRPDDYHGTTNAKVWARKGFPTVVDVPATAASAGTLGTIAFDASHAYFCTTANTWKRVAIATW